MQLFQKSISNILSKLLITYNHNINIILNTLLHIMCNDINICKLYNLILKANQQQSSQPIYFTHVDINYMDVERSVIRV